MNDKNKHFGRYISLLYRQGNSFLSKKYAKFGIGSGQYLFMINLYRNDGISQEKLSEIINIDKGTTAKAIKKLEDGGLVVRVKDDNDKRVNKIYLTEKAFEIKTEFLEILHHWDNTLTQDLSQEEIQYGLKILEKMTKNIPCEEDN